MLGAEGQYSWLGKNNLNATFPGGYVYNNNQRGLGSITARVGYTWGPGLVYVKGGYAYSDNRERLTFAGAPVAFLLNGNHSNGWTVGAGVEYMFAPNWSVKGEYMYYDFGSTRFVTPAALAPFGSFRTDDHTLKLGVNYRFNFAARWSHATDRLQLHEIAERPAFMPAFLLFGAVFRFTEKIRQIKLNAVKNAAKSLPVSKLVNRVPGYCRARKHLKVA